MEKIISKILSYSMNTQKLAIEDNMLTLLTVSRLIASCFHQHRKLYIFGNGGSAADAQHIAAEFVNRFLIERLGYPAIALTTDTSILTSISNDYGYNSVFARQIYALGEKGDIAWGISTSGRSENVSRGVRAARIKGMITICSTGDIGSLRQLVDYAIVVPSSITPRVQEAHLLIAHIICSLVDRILYPKECKGKGAEYINASI